MLFNKKSVVKIYVAGEDFEISTTTAKLNDAELFSCLKNNFDKYGALAITNITDDEIQITTNETLEYKEAVQKANEIKDLIISYISKK